MNANNTRIFMTLPVLAMLAATGGCDDAVDPIDTHEESAVEHGCEHFEDTPVMLTASWDDISLPSANHPHELLEVTLTEDPATPGAFGGSLVYTSTEAVDLVFLQKVGVGLTLTAADGSLVVAEATVDAPAECAAAARATTFEVGIGTYIIGLTGASAGPEAMVLVHDDEHDDHDEH